MKVQKVFEYKSKRPIDYKKILITNFKQFNINETFEDEYHEKIGEDYPSNYVEDIITKELGYDENWYSGSAAWGSCHVWSVSDNDTFTGTFVIVDPDNDDEVVLLDRTINNENYVDTDHMTANNLEELYKLLDFVKSTDKFKTFKKFKQAKKFKLM